MTKETFCKLIEAIKNLEEDKDKIADALETIIDGYAIVETGNKTIENIVDALASEMNDKDEWIEWWLFEDVEKVVSFSDGSPEVRLDTPEQLYDFLSENCEKKEIENTEHIG